MDKSFFASLRTERNIGLLRRNVSTLVLYVQESHGFRGDFEWNPLALESAPFRSKPERTSRNNTMESLFTGYFFERLYKGEVT